MLRLLLPLLGLLLALSACSNKKTYEYAFLDPDLPIDQRVDDLVGRLTTEEKIAQMLNTAPAVERLGIPAYNWWNEALHGVARSPYPATSFPQAIGIAATWDEQAVLQTAAYISTEGRAIHHDAMRKGKPGIFTGLTYWTPNINIFRDPRWGRGQETYGEDPHLTAVIGSRFVNGLQEGDYPEYLKASACAKHFAVHSGPEWNRHVYNAEVSPHDLWDTYLPAFRELVVNAGVTGVMCAYNAYFGQPCCGSDALMMEILKEQWNFDGYVTSDCGAIDDFYRTHKTHPDAATAAADAVLHGTDCECGNRTYFALAEALGKGLITEAQIDASVKRLFKIRFRLGMFDPADRVGYASVPLSALEAPEHRAHALEVARKSIVLLRNEGNLLPLDKNRIKKIAVVGPNADSRSVLLANYYGYPSEITTLLQGLKDKASGIEIIYDKGVNLTDDYVFSSAYRGELFGIDGKPGFKAMYYQNTKFEGEPALTRIEDKIDYRWGDGADVGDSIIARRMSAVWSTVFTPDISGEVCFEVKADDYAEFLIDGVKQDKVGLIDAYYPLKAEKGKQYRIEIRYLQFADNAEISFDLGSLRRADVKATAALAAEADVIIYAGGISARVEGEEMGVQIEGFRRGDRTSLDLPSVQKDMLRALHATGKPVVFVLMTGSAIGLEWESKNIPAIVNAWYGGQAGGRAVADVLFGDYNPAGRLPVTFYKGIEDLPDFEDYSMANRTYRYFRGTPVYPFGYGLSYTSFRYDNLWYEFDGKALQLKVDVTNTGSRAGEEVVQLYVSNERDFPTPIRALKQFNRVELAPGATSTVWLSLSPEALTVVNDKGEQLPMEGEIVVSVGGGQPSERLIAAGQCIVEKIALK
ncbi:MAG: glycoside hydrolase family 3 C-terminal domain-containing protein [Tannerellaceae bacterium]|nr:glycoside hydrolase family 3 C-terminal domain-containing protein [Tannerellaceae bacterium]